MTTWEDHIKTAMKTVLEREGVADVARVVHWEENSYTDGFCEPCRYTQIVVEITYRDTNDRYLVHTYRGDFADLIRELGNAEL